MRRTFDMFPSFFAFSSFSSSSFTSSPLKQCSTALEGEGVGGNCKDGGDDNDDNGVSGASDDPDGSNDDNDVGGNGNFINNLFTKFSEVTPKDSTAVVMPSIPKNSRRR